MPRTPFVTLSALIAPLLLAGCVNTADQGPCPGFGILKDAEFFPAPSGSMPNAPFLAEMTDVSLTCTYFNRRPLSAELRFKVEVAAKDNSAFEANLPYFVAVTAGEEALIAREQFGLTVKVEDGDGSAREVVGGIEIPLADGFTGAGYHVLVGFSLSPQQLERNRRASSAIPTGEEQSAR